MAHTQEGRPWGGAAHKFVRIDGEHDENSLFSDDLQPSTGLEHVSAPMARVLYQIGARMLRNRYGLSAGQAAAVANLLVMRGTAHG